MPHYATDGSNSPMVEHLENLDPTIELSSSPDVPHVETCVLPQVNSRRRFPTPSDSVRRRLRRVRRALEKAQVFMQ